MDRWIDGSINRWMDGYIETKREREMKKKITKKIRYFMFGFSEQSVVEGGMAAD